MVFVIKREGLVSSERRSGRLLDGRTWDEMPEGVR